jgi:hypothetical protein
MNARSVPWIRPYFPCSKFLLHRLIWQQNFRLAFGRYPVWILAKLQLPNWGVCVFPQSLQVKAQTVLETGHDYLLSNPYWAQRCCNNAWEVPSSNLSWITRYPNWAFLSFPSVSQRHCLNYLEIGHDCLLPSAYLSIIHDHLLNSLNAIQALQLNRIVN